MRRAAALVFGTLAGTSLLVGAKVGSASTPAPPSAGGAGTSAVVLTGSGGVTTTAGPASPHASAGGRPATTTTPAPHASGTTATPTTKPAPGKTTAKPTPTPKPTPTVSGPKDGSYKASSSEKYGTVTLTVTISGHKITDIAANYNSNSPSYCTNKACPKLRTEALAAQSANIASVSGATYTSQAYIAALKAVLNAAG